MDNENIVMLTDDEGNDVPFEFLDLVEYEGGQYVVLLPTEGDEEDAEVVILEVKEGEGDEEAYVSVDNEETLMAVFEIFKERFEDEFNFVD